MKKIYFTTVIFSLLTIYLLYSYFSPNEYIFLCDGLSKKSEYSLEDKKKLLRKDNFLDFEREREVLKVKKYFFGKFYTLNNYSKDECNYDDDDNIIFCSKTPTDDYLEFNTIKLTLEKKSSRSSSFTFDVIRFNCICSVKDKLL